jgi:hypothetical protein
LRATEAIMTAGGCRRGCARRSRASSSAGSSPCAG